MTRDRQATQRGTEEVAPLIESTQSPDSAPSASSPANDQHDNNIEEHTGYVDDDDQGSIHGSDSWNKQDDYSDQGEDYFEAWDDRDPQSYTARQDTAVYACAPKHGTFLLAAIAGIFLFLLSELAHALVRDIGYVGGDGKERKRLQQAVVMYFVLNWLALLLVGISLPRKYEILANSTMVVGTTLTRFHFDDIRSAQRNSLYCLNSDTVKRLRFDFATDCENRVVIKRGGHKWEVACSPKDPDEFVEAIRNICNNSNSNQAATEMV